jgi:hypothetical protein
MGCIYHMYTMMEGGDRGGPWSPQNKEKKIKSKKNKNIKFGSNFSHMVPPKIFLALFLIF